MAREMKLDARRLKDDLVRKSLGKIITGINGGNENVNANTLAMLDTSFESVQEDIKENGIPTLTPSIHGDLEEDTIPRNPNEVLVQGLLDSINEATDLYVVGANGSVFINNPEITDEEMHAAVVVEAYESAGLDGVTNIITDILDGLKTESSQKIESVGKYILSLIKNKQESEMDSDMEGDDEFKIADTSVDPEEDTDGEEGDKAEGDAEPFGDATTEGEDKPKADDADPFSEGGSDDSEDKPKESGDSDPFADDSSDTEDKKPKENSDADPFAEDNSGEDKSEEKETDPFSESGNESVDISNVFITVGNESIGGVVRRVYPFASVSAADVLAINKRMIKQNYEARIDKAVELGLESTEYVQLTAEIKNSANIMTKSLVDCIVTTSALGIKVNKTPLLYND